VVIYPFGRMRESAAHAQLEATREAKTPQ